jgi:hypothetical protein
MNALYIDIRVACGLGYIQKRPGCSSFGCLDGEKQKGDYRQYQLFHNKPPETSHFPDISIEQEVCQLITT